MKESLKEKEANQFIIKHRNILPYLMCTNPNTCYISSSSMSGKTHGRITKHSIIIVCLCMSVYLNTITLGFKYVLIMSLICKRTVINLNSHLSLTILRQRTFLLLHSDILMQEKKMLVFH